MKISKFTLTLLKNFTNINKSILVRCGNSLSIMSKDRSTYALAEVEETFPVECAIYDIHKFLSTVALFSDPEFVFESDFVRLESKNKHLIFKYADSSIADFVDGDIKANQPKGTPQKPKKGVTFKLSAEDIKSILDSAGVLNLSHLNISSEKGKIVVSVVDPDNVLANKLVIDTDVETSSDFNVMFKISRLTLVAGDYSVTIYKPAPTVVTGYFKHEAKNVQYWIAAEVTSEFN